MGVDFRKKENYDNFLPRLSAVEFFDVETPPLKIKLQLNSIITFKKVRNFPNPRMLRSF